MFQKDDLLLIKTSSRIVHYESKISRNCSRIACSM